MRIFHTYTAITLWRCILLYIIAMLCRAVFVICNFKAFNGFTAAEIPALIAGALQFDTVSILYLNAPWLLLSLVPFRFRERRLWQEMLFWYYAVANSIFIIIVNLADAVYFRYAGKRFTAEEIFFADNSNSPLLILKFALENWYLAVAAAALIALLVWGYRRRAKIKVLAHSKSLYCIANTLTLLLAAGAATVGIRGGITRMTRPLAVPAAMRYAQTAAKANIVLSNPFCIFRTATDPGGGNTEFFSREELYSIYSPYHYPAPNPETSALKGRNVVIFVMESFSAEYSAVICKELYGKSETKGYIPFLDSLMSEGFTFMRMYANGQRSIQALPTIWSSIPSFVTPFMLMPESLGETYPLPRILRDEGYATAFFCGSEQGSMGFGAYAKTAGFEREFAMEDYERRHGKGDFDGYWGIWDGPFMQYMGEELDTLPQPFLASIFTLTSHHPFVVPDTARSAIPQNYDKIHRGVAYTDNAVSEFFDTYKDREWFANTIFVFIADHTLIAKFSDKNRVPPHDTHIVGLIYTPDGAIRGSYDRTASQIDIMPTLLGLLGYDKPYFAYGRDIFNEPCDDPMAVSFDGEYRIVTDDYVYGFSDGQIRYVYAVGDTEREDDLLKKGFRNDDVLLSTKALIQQYYEHAAHKNYTVNDSLRPDNARD